MRELIEDLWPELVHKLPPVLACRTWSLSPSVRAVAAFKSRTNGSLIGRISVTLRGTRGVAELKQLVVLLTTFNSALIPLVEPPDSPASIAITKTKTSIRPLASDTRAGPGQYPANPQPTPKITAPEIRGASMAVEVGRLKRGDQSGRPRPNTRR